jgi:uncharacterized protein (TIGR02145 family)
MKTMRFLTLAAVSAALAFTFTACGGDDGDDGGGCDPAATVTIGNQTWLKCNLNVPSDDYFGKSSCYGGSKSNCDKFGRLYDYAAAMALIDNCNTIDCDFMVEEPHQGLCPNGFHIPTDDEWKELRTAAGEETSATKLKTKSDWMDNRNGTDDFGFSALPGGYGNSTGGFGQMGAVGLWLSASRSATPASAASVWFMDSDARVKQNNAEFAKGNQFSVRCIKN